MASYQADKGELDLRRGAHHWLSLADWTSQHRRVVSFNDDGYRMWLFYSILLYFIYFWSFSVAILVLSFSYSETLTLSFFAR